MFIELEQYSEQNGKWNRADIARTGDVYSNYATCGRRCMRETREGITVSGFLQESTYSKEIFLNEALETEYWNLLIFEK